MEEGKELIYPFNKPLPEFTLQQIQERVDIAINEYRWFLKPIKFREGGKVGRYILTAPEDTEAYWFETDVYSEFITDKDTILIIPEYVFDDHIMIYGKKRVKKKNF